MSRGLFRSFILVFMASFWWGCEKNMPEPANMKDLRALTLEEKSLIEQSNQLAFNFLTQLEKKEPEHNIFFSPLSIGMAMGMMYNGIDEQGKRQFNTMMDFSGSEVQVNKTFHELTRLLKNIDKNVNISLSNSFWHHRKYVMNDLYKDKIMAYYSADAEGLNFESGHASNYINRVVSFKMNKEVERVNYSIPANLEIMQINAIGFSGKWTYAPELVVEGRFFNGKKNTYFEFIRDAIVQVYKDEENKILDIPYGNGQYSMTIIMPDEPGSNSQISNRIDYSDFLNHMSNSDTVRMDLILPVIGVNYKFNLKDLFSKFNIHLVPEINHNTMFVGPAPLSIDAVIQDAFFDPPFVQEMLPLVSDQEILSEGNVFVLDKPFTYFIREKHTGIILFAGKFLNSD